MFPPLTCRFNRGMWAALREITCMLRVSRAASGRNWVKIVFNTAKGKWGHILRLHTPLYKCNNGAPMYDWWNVYLCKKGNQIVTKYSHDRFAPTSTKYERSGHDELLHMACTKGSQSTTTTFSTICACMQTLSKLCKHGIPFWVANGAQLVSGLCF